MYSTRIVIYYCARDLRVFYTVFCYVFCMFSTRIVICILVLVPCVYSTPYSVTYSVSIRRTPTTIKVFFVYVLYFVGILCVFSPCELRGPPYTYRRIIADVFTEESQEAEGAGSRGSEDSLECA